MRLKNKVAIVTGGTRGIGRSIAELFAEEGAKIIAIGKEELSYSHPNIEGYQLDVIDSQKCKELFDYVVNTYGTIDILINNAAITEDSLTRKMSDEQWHSVINVNLTGVFNMTRHIGPYMQKNGGGSIINISSVVGEFGNIGQANYAASKAGVIGLTKSWAKEFSMKSGNVRVNAISPGYTMTDMLKTIPQDLLATFASQTMLGRLAQPIEIARSALFLASDDASYITGHELSVNGGMRL